MANQIKAPINYPIIAGGKIVSGGSVIFGQPNVKPDPDNPSTLKAIYLDAALKQQAENPQGISSDGVFDQSDTGILYGPSDTVYSIVILGANKKQLSYIPEYDLSDANAAQTAQDAAAAAASSEANAIAAKDLTEALYTDFTNRYFGAYSSNPAVDDLGNPPNEGSIYFNTTSDVFYTWNGSAWMNYFPSNPSGLMVTATGTTTPRSLADRAANVVNVKDFGATGDGITDDTLAIQAALDSYDRVNLPSGDYLVSDTLRLNSNNDFFGDGKSSRIVMADSVEGTIDVVTNKGYGSVSLAYDDNIKIRNMIIFANGFQRTKSLPIEWGRCIRFAAVSNVLIEGVHAVEGPQHCIDITNWNDTYYPYQGHLSGDDLIGKSYNITIRDTYVIDYCYDDGITTHACNNVLIENCVSVITDNAKTKTTYASTQNGFEIDDGSVDVLVKDCRVYGNATLSKGFSTACHPNAPATNNITFRDCHCEDVNIGYTTWTDLATDVAYDSEDWEGSNVKFINCSIRRPHLRTDSNIYPSRWFVVQGTTDVLIDGLTVNFKGHDGTTDALTTVGNIQPCRRLKLKNLKVLELTEEAPIGEIQANAAYIQVGSNCEDVSVDGVTISNMGSIDRVVSDTSSSAITSVSNLEVRDIPAGAVNKAGIVTSAEATYRSIKVPAGMLPYRVGRNFTSYESDNIDINSNREDLVIGGTNYLSENVAGVQPKPAITFKRYFSSGSDPSGTQGKGTLAFWTTQSDQQSFSISAWREDLDEYQPIVGAYANDTLKSWSPVVTLDTSLGQSNRRFTRVYSEKINLLSPNGTEYVVSVTDAGALQVDPA